jgi:hypothetical protein
MFAIEILVFILAVIALCVRGLWMEYAANRNESRQDAALARLLDPMIGEPIATAIARFGQPTEYLAGTTGRGLYVWLAPPAKRFPPGRGVLVVTLTADSDGNIASVNWKARAT